MGYCGLLQIALTVVAGKGVLKGTRKRGTRNAHGQVAPAQSGTDHLDHRACDGDGWDWLRSTEAAEEQRRQQADQEQRCDILEDQERVAPGWRLQGRPGPCRPGGP